MNQRSLKPNPDLYDWMWQVFQQLSPYTDVVFNHSLQDGNDGMQGSEGASTWFADVG